MWTEQVLKKTLFNCTGHLTVLQRQKRNIYSVTNYQSSCRNNCWNHNKTDKKVHAHIYVTLHNWRSFFQNSLSPHFILIELSLGWHPKPWNLSCKHTRIHRFTFKYWKKHNLNIVVFQNMTKKCQYLQTWTCQTSEFWKKALQLR